MTDDGLRTEFLFDLNATVTETQHIGDTPFGRRRIYVVSTGTFSGPRLSGVLLPGGTDWLMRGTDGVSELDVRATLRTDDDSLIYYHYRGIYHVDAQVKDRMDRGDPVQPSEYYFRTSHRFETGEPKYRWLNTVLAVGVGRRTDTGLAYRVYQVL